MKKLLFLLIVGLLLAGCTPAATLTPIVMTTANGTVIEYIGDQDIPTIQEGFGIYGPEADFDGVYPGWSGTIPVTVINGKDKERTFTLTALEYASWVSISEPEFVVPAGGTYQVPVTLAIPENTSLPKNFDIDILVADSTQTGLVQIGYTVKWHIKVR